jgi:UDP-N-acetylmuramoyl-L-alanyl-D-glutamate--2,6-diaminopimelate ligase
VSREVANAARDAGRRVLLVGRGGDFLTLETAERRDFAQRLSVRHAGKMHTIDLPLIGDYQASNALVAAGLAIAAGDAADAVLPSLSRIKGVKGRLEIVGRLNGGLIVVDYAHKPEALTAALSAARGFATGRVVCVFGCGGDRDKGKRPLMGAIAAKLSDIVIVTDDNPRSETPATIRAEILAAAPGAREIGDRTEAIRAGMAALGAGDVLVIAGKGHETGQIVGSTVIPFSDHEAIATALAETR